MSKKIILLAFLCLTWFDGAFASYLSETGGDSSKEWLSINDRTVALNGRGVYSILFFHIYEISLYLERPSSEAQYILQYPGIKVIRIKFLRDVKAEDVRHLVSSGFRENCGSERECDRLKVYLEQVNARILDYNEGDELEFQLHPNKLVLRSGLGQSMAIEEKALNLILLKYWLGEDPPSGQLKERLLGHVLN